MTTKDPVSQADTCNQKWTARSFIRSMLINWLTHDLQSKVRLYSHPPPKNVVWESLRRMTRALVIEVKGEPGINIPDNQSCGHWGWWFWWQSNNEPVSVSTNDLDFPRHFFWRYSSDVLLHPLHVGGECRRHAKNFQFFQNKKKNLISITRFELSTKYTVY